MDIQCQQQSLRLSESLFRHRRNHRLCQRRPVYDRHKDGPTHVAFRLRHGWHLFRSRRAQFAGHRGGLQPISLTVGRDDQRGVQPHRHRHRDDERKLHVDIAPQEYRCHVQLRAPARLHRLANEGDCQLQPHKRTQRRRQQSSFGVSRPLRRFDIDKPRKLGFRRGQRQLRLRQDIQQPLESVDRLEIQPQPYGQRRVIPLSERPRMAYARRTRL